MTPNMHHIIPPQLHTSLSPPPNMGCKRIVAYTKPTTTLPPYVDQGTCQTICNLNKTVGIYLVIGLEYIIRILTSVALSGGMSILEVTCCIHLRTYVRSTMVVCCSNLDIWSQMLPCLDEDPA